MKENRRVSNTRPVAHDDSAHVVEVISNTTARRAAQQEWDPQTQQEMVPIKYSPMVEGVLSLPIEERTTQRYREGIKEGRIQGILGLSFVVMQIVMVYHVLFSGR